MAVARKLCVVPAMLAIAGCAKTVVPMATPVPAGTSVTVTNVDTGLPTDWKTLMLPADAVRLSLIGSSWEAALGEARARKFGAAIAAEGPLLDPKAALPRPAPPPGRYRCRIVKLGLSETGKGAGFARFKPFYCFIATEDALLVFTKATGTQRPGGRIWDDGEKRMIFMGGVAEGSAKPPAYGDDPKHSLVGVVERIDDFRWRLVTPTQSPDARLEVMELVPDTPPPAEPAQ